MKDFIVGLLTSRRVVASVGGVLAALLVSLLNKKLGLGLDPAEVVTTVTGIVAITFAYIVSRTVTDVKGTVPAPTAKLPPEVQAVVDALKK